MQKRDKFGRFIGGKAANNKYVKTNDGTIIISLGGKVYNIAKDHPNYATIAKDIKSITVDRLDIRKSIETIYGLRVDPQKKVIIYRGQEISNKIVEYIFEFMRKNKPYKHLIKFLSNLIKNPSYKSQQELFDFMQGRNFEITKNGTFVAYKGVRNDLKDVHSGKIDNSPGKTITMPRSGVDDNSNNTCSYGYHVGSLEYAKSWGPTLLKVEVNPEHVVSVPNEHGAHKLRVCEYRVLEVVEK